MNGIHRTLESQEPNIQLGMDPALAAHAETEATQAVAQREGLRHRIAHSRAARAFAVGGACVAMAGEAGPALASDAHTANTASEEAAALIQYKQKCARQGIIGVSGVRAAYTNSSRNKLKITAGVTPYQSCDNDRGDLMDVGDKEFFASREVYNPRLRKWQRSGSEINLDESSINMLGSIKKSFATRTCGQGTKYRGVVRVKWTPHQTDADNGIVAGSKKFPSASKTC